MNKKTVLMAMILLFGCVGCATVVETPVAVQPQISLEPPVSASEPLTLKQIMADPDWMGNGPLKALWSADGLGIYYQRKQVGSQLNDLFYHPLGGNPTKVGFDGWHNGVQKKSKWNEARTAKAWLYHGNLFLWEQGKSLQLTQDSRKVTDFWFLNDGRLAFARDNRIEVIHPQHGRPSLLAEMRFADAPKPLEAKNYLAKQQRRLIQHVDQQYQKSQQKFERNRQRQQQDSSLPPAPFYFSKELKIHKMAVSPSGRYVLVALEDKAKTRAKHDIMPDYLHRSGHIHPVSVRARVAEAKPKPHQLILLDLIEREQTRVNWDGLVDFDKDVLAKVRAENAKVKGDSYEGKRQQRVIRLMLDWSWKQSPIQWHPSEDRLLVMLESADNKDRWLASVDIESGKLTTQHHQHDEAWINYENNEFGWVDSKHIYYLSEQTGFSQLYLKPLGGKARALTRGRQVVSNPLLSRDANYFYYRANPHHPGQYEVFRVALKSGESEQLTDLKGMLNYRLSPDQSKLLLEFSSRTRPMELFVQEIGKQAQQLTQTTSKSFLDYPWQAPQVVAIPSSHQELPVYARLFLPADFDPNKRYPAVVFNHGAGYLQNAHFGWSDYFREYMFHNLLAQRGYVVLDTDYRGSKGYGRDWRTAIYRQMGYPEVEDLRDGVDWLAKHVSVDPSRVGTYGGSYGGFLTFMALFNQPDLFQAGAALRPVTDWAHYNLGYTSNILNTPDIDPIAYERSSPIEHAEGLEKPLLIMAGVMDNNVFFQDSVRLVQRLIELEKPMFETAIYPVEAHSFKQPSSWLDEYRRILRLFEDNLK